MKITHVIESSGGSADFVLYLVKYLPHHNHSIIYSDRTFGKRLAEIKSIYSDTTFCKWLHVQREIRIWPDIKATISLYKLLKQIDSDVIHLHSSKAGFIGRLVCFLQRKKQVIYTPNGLAFLRKDVSKFKVKLYEILEKIAHHLTGKVISCSHSEAQALIEKRIYSTYINNGTEIFECITSNRVKKDAPLTIATTGRATIQKNPRLFNFIAKHFENNANYNFLWIGGGELEYELSSKNIKITGWMDRSQVIERLTKVDVYISTASWEGLPFAVLEAMNLNKPLVLSNCVGNIDLVQNGFNGFIFDTGEQAIEKIELLNNKKELINFMGKNSRQMVVNSFSVEDMAKQYEIAYMGLGSYNTKIS